MQGLPHSISPPLASAAREQPSFLLVAGQSCAYAAFAFFVHVVELM
jgi:hypothetical protein